MKRIVICAFIMLALVAVGIVSLFYTESVVDEAAKNVDEISVSFEEGDFEGAKRLTQTLSDKWENYYQRHIFMVDKDHAMEITMAIGRICSMAEQEDDDLPTECAAASQLIRLYGRKHNITPENIF